MTPDQIRALPDQHRLDLIAARDRLYRLHEGRGDCRIVSVGIECQCALCDIERLFMAGVVATSRLALPVEAEPPTCATCQYFDTRDKRGPDCAVGVGIPASVLWKTPLSPAFSCKLHEAMPAPPTEDR